MINLFITLTNIGYEIGIWREEDLPEDVLQSLSQEAEFSECRDYGYDINPDRGGFKILEYVKELDQDLMRAREGLKDVLDELEIDRDELDKYTQLIEKIYEDGVYATNLTESELFICDGLYYNGVIEKVKDTDNRNIYIKPINNE